MNIAEVRRLVGKIRSRLFKKANSEAVGSLKSQFRGSGLQFKEHQVYAPGDDVRFIDWKLLAKMNTPFIKTFEEERNIDIVALIDCSQSMGMGVDGISKLQAAIELTCLIYLLAENTKDRLSVILVTDEIVSIPGNAGERGISALMSVLEKKGIASKDGKLLPPKSNAGMNQAQKLSIVMKNLQRKKEVIIMSDFVDFFSMEDIKKLSWNKNAHFYRIKSPFDFATLHPFSVMATNSDSRVHGQVYFSFDEKVFSGLRVKEIDLERNYLDEFVRDIR
jgi:uncharacterized protein (DUF58 family)